jgi:anti-sigma-K factor RskA
MYHLLLILQILVVRFDCLLFLANTRLIQFRSHWGWRLAVLLTGIAAVLVWAVALSSCKPKPAPPVTAPVAVDTTRQRLEQSVRVAKDTLRANHQKSESAVTNYQNAAKDYDASRVQIP